MLPAVRCSKLSNSCDAPKAAYIHIPFCRRRCFYCDFPVSIVGDKPPIATSGVGFGTIARYVEVLCQEICLTANLGQPLETVFFGGGTPSLLSAKQLNRILEGLDQQIGIAAKAEISMEIDPGTFDLAQIQGYRSAGVNRVSLGVQAFQAELLKVCGRSHTVADVYSAVELIHQAQITNFSLDLISGLPHQTLEHWQDSLQRAIALQPAHLSCYDLTVEPITAFARHYRPGISPLPSDDLTADMYRAAQQYLTAAGYNHYEISNYAKQGCQCQHNRVYWENRPFYGFGMGATSYIKGDRLSRPRKTREYYEWVEERVKDKGLRINQELKLNAAELLLDTLMLGLRLAEGLSLERMAAQFGRETLERIWTCLQPYYTKGWVEVVPDLAIPDQVTLNQTILELTTVPQMGRLKLSDPEGFLFSNIVLVALFEAFADGA